MESFFHGSSSGLDPLNSYLSLPILIHSKDKIEPTGIPSQNPEGKELCFYWTVKWLAKLHPWFPLHEEYGAGTFRMMMKEEFIRYTDQCVEDFLSGTCVLCSFTPKNYLNWFLIILNR